MKTEQEQINLYLNECHITDYEIIGSHYLGYHRMMFGTRLRAGKLFDYSCEIDICCGKGDYFKKIVRDLYAKKMKKNHQNCKPIFTGLLASSEVKPINKDQIYMNFLTELMDELKNK